LATYTEFSKAHILNQTILHPVAHLTKHFLGTFRATFALSIVFLLIPSRIVA
jgi:hypothetical protein